MASANVERPPSLNESFRSLKLQGHVGFDSLPDQLVKRSVQEGYAFNILCIGETGIGKSTLMDSLFNTTFDSSPSPHNLPAVKLKAKTYDLQEKNVNLKLTIVDTVGYGDQINKEDSFKAIVEYIDSQFEMFLQEELKIKRSLVTYHDTRIHVCLYFISPTGHGLKSIDLVCMKKLDSKVNIIPIIAKADTISKVELQKFKIKIMSELVSNGVQIYQFPTDDDTVSEINSTMNTLLPFAVVGSTDFVRVGNKVVRARQYPWGTIIVENENHCDFVKLREMLIRTNMEDMRDQTHARHYELYRRMRLEQMGFSDVGADNKPISFQETYEQKRQEHLQELQRKEEEMRQMFVVRVKEKESELKDAEKEKHLQVKEKESCIKYTDEELNSVCYQQLFYKRICAEVDYAVRKIRLSVQAKAFKKFYKESKKKFDNKRRNLAEEINNLNKRKVDVLKNEIATLSIKVSFKADTLDLKFSSHREKLAGETKMMNEDFAQLIDELAYNPENKNTLMKKYQSESDAVNNKYKAKKRKLEKEKKQLDEDIKQLKEKKEKFARLLRQISFYESHKKK